IQYGVDHFAAVYASANGDVKLALQAYNFGGGFINYANERGGYSLENAIAFSKMKAAEKGKKRYGDPYYVDHVLRYYNATSTAIDIIPGEQ
ncbi:lysozyme family protein, partial [Klebsiella pneumoniae]